MRSYSDAYANAERWMRRYGWGALTIFAFFPFLVFDLVGIIAGVLRLPLWRFLLATYAGRLPRSFVEAYFGFQVFPFLFPSLLR